MTIRERIAQHPHHDDSGSFDRALIRAGLIIIAGYLAGTLIAWLIVR